MKKFLSLVLALVMTMSLVTVSAGAKDFSDDDSITYQEAVDVISEIGVVDGYTGGDFKPTDVLTRGAAAKIICNLVLGPTTASYLTADTAPFKDVPVTNTFAGYITYCSQQGIINGYADGTFRPTGTLTGNAFMKMLLGALGYDSTIEGYTGPNWTVNVIKQAAGIGLDDGNDEFVGSKAVTREEAALYAFNMLQAVMVEYDAKTTVNVNGATVTIAGDKASPVAWETGKNNDGNIGKADGFIQFAEQYFDKLVLNDTTSDDFGRPANTWSFKGVKVGTYPKATKASYTADVTLGTIYADLGMTSKDSEVEVYVDGVQADELAIVSRNNDLKVSEVVFDDNTVRTAPKHFCQVGNGTLVEAFLNENTNDVTIVAINTYAAEVNKVVAASGNKPAYITLTELETEKGSGYESDLQANDEFETEGFASDDIVLFTYANNEIQSVKAAESVTGELTRRELTKNLTLGETKYSYSNKYDIDGVEADLSVGSEYEAYLDEYGYAIYVEETEYNIADYAFLRVLQSGSNAFQSDKAALWTYQGKGATVNLTKDYHTEDAFASYPVDPTPELDIGDDDALIVLARENSAGEYRLKALPTTNYADGVGNTSTDDFTMRNGVARIMLDTTNNKYVYADDRTQVVLHVTKTDGSDAWHAYSGTDNMPTIEPISGRPDSIGVSYYSRSSGVATIMFIDVDEDDYTVTAGNNDVIFFSPESASKHTEDAQNSYYSYKAVVNGEIVDEVKVEDDIAVYAYPTFNANGEGASDLAFTEVEYDDGVIVDVDTIRDGGADGSFVALGVNKLSNGNLQVGYNAGSKTYGNAFDGTYVVSKDVKVFFMDDNGDITEGTMSGVRRSDTDIVTAVLDDGQITYLFVQQYFDDEDHGRVPQTPADVRNLSGATYNNTTGVLALTFNFNGTPIAGTYEVQIESLVGGVTNLITDVDVYVNASGAVSQTIPTNLMPNLGSGVYVVRYGSTSTVITVS